MDNLRYVSQGKIQNFSSICPKLCLLGQKYAGTWGVNTTIINLNQVSISENHLCLLKAKTNEPDPLELNNYK